MIDPFVAANAAIGQLGLQGTEGKPFSAGTFSMLNPQTGAVGAYIDGNNRLRTTARLTENVTATKTLTKADQGKTVFLNSATEFVSTLPAPYDGAYFKFVVVAAPSGASYTVVTNASANIIIGKQYSAAGDAGDTGTADDTVTFVDGQSVAGDSCEFESDGTSWFATAFSKVAAGITFTQAS